MPCSCFVLWDLIGFSAILDFHSYSPTLSLCLCLSLFVCLSLCINFVCKRSCWRILGVHSLSAFSICSCSLCVLKFKTTSDLQLTCMCIYHIMLSYHALSCHTCAYLRPTSCRFLRNCKVIYVKFKSCRAQTKDNRQGLWGGESVCACKGCTKKVDIKIIKQQGVKSVKQFPQCKFYDPAMQWKRKWAKAEQIRPQAH